MSSLLTETLPGAPGGVNMALPAQDIDDTQARNIQDALVDIPALTRRRGPAKSVAVIAQPTRKVSGIVNTLDPQGVPRYAVLNGDGSNGYMSVYSDDLSALVDLTLAHPLPTDPVGGSPYRIVDSKPGLNGGAFIGISSGYDVGADQSLIYWLGGNKANYTTGTITIARGGKTVTGSGTSWNANLAAGMWLFANTDEGYTNTLIGYVAKVNSNTSLTLGDPSPYALTAKAYTGQSLRGVYPRVNTGRVTCATTTTDLNGGDTEFAKQGLGTGTWNVYRAEDWAFIGKVSTVESDIHATLAANAAVAMADDSYYAIRADGNWSMDIAADVGKPGFMNATYAQRQFFLNKSDSHQDTYELIYTDVADPEAYNLSLDGTTDFVGSTSIVQESARGIAAAYNALLIFKENETYQLSGSEPSQFSISKIENDGTLGTGSIQPYGGGIIWAGREGIHFYDGVQVNNLTQDKLGNVWKDSIRTFDPTVYRMYSVVDRDHYILHIENLVPTVTPIKGTLAEQSNSWVVVINMVTQALTFATNLPFRGGIILPAVSGNKVWYVINGQQPGDTADHGFVADGESLFDDEGTDIIYGEYGYTHGPWTNLIYNGDFESDASGWGFVGATLAQDGTQFKYGAHSGKIIYAAGGTVFVSFAHRITAAPGDTFTLSARVKGTAGKVIDVDVGFVDSGGADTTPDTHQHFTLTGGWDDIVLTGTAGASTDHALPVFTDVTGTAHTVYLDGVQYETGPVAHAFVSTNAGAASGSPLRDSGLVGGPDFYFESKKFDAGDALRLKKFKILALHYLAQGGALKVDTVLGLNDFGQTTTSDFPASVFTWDTLRASFRTWSLLSAKFSSWNDVIQSVFVPKRIKFQKQSQFLAFRIYQENTTMSRVKIGPFQLAYKVMRAGRV